jgi:hypothetical protein
MKTRLARRNDSIRHRQPQAADAVVLKLFADLQLAAWARQHSPQNREVAKAFEAQVWGHLMHYLTTFERPDLPSFNRLEKWPGRRSLRGVIKEL